MKGGDSSSSDYYNNAGFTPICWPDGTATTKLGFAGKGGDDKDSGSSGDGPSAMIFFQSYPPQIQGISNLSYEFILLNGYYIVTITGGNGTVFFNQTISDFTMNVILVGGGGAGGANSYVSIPSLPDPQYTGGGGGGGGAILQTTLSSSVGQISVNIGTGGVTNPTTPTTPTSPTSTSITYGSTTLTANPGANGGNGDAPTGFLGGVGGAGGITGGGAGGDGYGTQPNGATPTNAVDGTSVDINGVTYWFGGGGAGGSDEPFPGGLGGGGTNSIGLPNSGGGGAGAPDLIVYAADFTTTPGYNGGSGVLILYFPATN